MKINSKLNKMYKKTVKEIKPIHFLKKIILNQKEASNRKFNQIQKAAQTNIKATLYHLE